MVVVDWHLSTGVARRHAGDIMVRIWQVSVWRAAEYLYTLWPLIQGSFFPLFFFLTNPHSVSTVAFHSTFGKTHRAVRFVSRLYPTIKRKLVSLTCIWVLPLLLTDKGHNHYNSQRAYWTETYVVIGHLLKWLMPSIVTGVGGGQKQSKK